jgi:hypothetical protein
LLTKWFRVRFCFLVGLNPFLSRIQSLITTDYLASRSIGDCIKESRYPGLLSSDLKLYLSWFLVIWFWITGLFIFFMTVSYWEALTLRSSALILPPYMSLGFLALALGENSSLVGEIVL